MKTVSIALASYNGAEYIEEQLESIRRQTRLPDEVVICDDGSTDRTVDIAKDFIVRHDLTESWRVVCNPIRLGCDRNFVECARKTSGDVIFFADQDDIWREKKISHMMEVFERYPNAYGVTCRSNLVDSSDKEIVKLSDRFTVKQTEKIVRYTLQEQIKFNRSAGLEIAFRRELLEDLGRIVAEYHVTHDQPVGMIASLRGEYYGINEVLLSHRIHEENLSAPRITAWSRIKQVADQIDGNEEHLKHMRAFREMFEKDIPEADLQELDAAISMTEEEISALKNRKCGKSVRLLCRKNNMINKWIFANNTLCTMFGDYRTLKNE